jgi:Rrf2 family protein
MMLKLSKKAEYAILAVQYLAENPGDKLNAKEIAQNLELSFEFLSKTMQSLMKSGLVNSIQGVKGGYVLSKPANSITLMEIMNATDEKIGIVNCMNIEDDDCNRNDKCAIKNPMHKIQKLIDGIFVNTTIYDLINGNTKIQNLNGYHKNLIEIKNII